MTAFSKKVDSNITGLSFAEEVSLGNLPTGTAQMVNLGYNEDSFGTSFAPGSGPPLSGIGLSYVVGTGALAITMVTREVLTEFHVRINHIRGGVTIATNIGTYVSDTPGLFTSAALAGHARKFSGGPINVVQTVTLNMSLSAVTFQSGDQIIVEVSRVVGYTNRSFRNAYYIGTELATWRALEPNSYEDFGGELTMLARNPINASRQRKKGVISDLDASGGFNTDLTQNGLTRLMQGFFFANAREKTSSLSLQNSRLTVTSFAAATGITLGDSGHLAFTVGNIVRMTGMAVAANNGNFVVSSITSPNVVLSPALSTEASFATGARIEVIGHQFASGVCSIAAVTGAARLTISAGSFATLGLNVGEWIYLGADTLTNRFTSNFGYARVKAIGTTTLDLDECTWTVTTDAGTGKSIHLYFGTFIRNEKDPTLIRLRSYQLERTLGYDDNGIMSEYLVGAVANEFTFNFESAEKVNCDLSFVGKDVQQRRGVDGVKGGTRTAALIEDAFNTSTDVYQMRLYVQDSTAITPTSLFGFVMDGNITINNNVAGLKAIGELGNFDVKVGDFEVGGELNCYFDTIEAVSAVRANANVGFNTILAADNAGMVFDVPLLALGNGRATVEKDEPIMLPLESAAAENTNGYTLSATLFTWLPTLAMT